MISRTTDELQKLKAELAQVKLERDILKKAVAFNHQDVTSLHGTRFESIHLSQEHRHEWDEDWSI